MNEKEDRDESCSKVIVPDQQRRSRFLGAYGGVEPKRNRVYLDALTAETLLSSCQTICDTVRTLIDPTAVSLSPFSTTCNPLDPDYSGSFALIRVSVCVTASSHLSLHIMVIPRPAHRTHATNLINLIFFEILTAPKQK